MPWACVPNSPSSEQQGHAAEDACAAVRVAAGSWARPAAHPWGRGWVTCGEGPHGAPAAVRGGGPGVRDGPRGHVHILSVRNPPSLSTEIPKSFFHVPSFFTGEQVTPPNNSQLSQESFPAFDLVVPFNNP